MGTTCGRVELGRIGSATASHRGLKLVQKSGLNIQSVLIEAGFRVGLPVAEAPAAAAAQG